MQKTPDIESSQFVLGEIEDLFKNGQIFINYDYQRGAIWKRTQKTELIKSIRNSYSVGVLVLYVNESGKYEILDGQQRLIAIKEYIEGTLNLDGTDITAYSDLDKQNKILIDAYCIYYLRIKSHDISTREEDVVQTFLRLQEGSPLNKAEKINAYRGKFKDVFREIREKHPLFVLMAGDKRFRLRLLAAEMLLLEMESDLNNRIFPSLELQSFVYALDKYKKNIPTSKLRNYRGNLDFLHLSLNYLLTALTPRDLLSLYLLISYLRTHRAGNKNLESEFSAFAKDFLRNLNSFSIYDQKPPAGMSRDVFDRYQKYKLESKVMTTPESLKRRFEIILGEFERLKPFIKRDPKRYHDEEEKRTLYFRQKRCLSVL